MNLQGSYSSSLLFNFQDTFFSLFASWSLLRPLLSALVYYIMDHFNCQVEFFELFFNSSSHLFSAALGDLFILSHASIIVNTFFVIFSGLLLLLNKKSKHTPYTIQFVHNNTNTFCVFPFYKQKYV